VQFEIETEEDTGKLKAVNVTNPDGSPVVPPPRERRRRQPKEDDGAEGGGEATAEGEEKTEDETAKKPRGKGKGRKPSGGKDDAKKSTTVKDPPFHTSISEDVKKTMEEKGLELGKRTTVDVAIGDARIKLGQGGYAGVALASAAVGEGSYTCDESGTVTFKWDRSLEFKDNAWTKGDESKLIVSLSLADGKCL
jgi:hypothetical protein